MTRLLESPWPILFFGIFALAVLGVALVRTGRGRLLWAMGGVVIVVLLGLLLEHLVVTERERIEDTLYGAAAAIEANDADTLMNYISPSAASMASRARFVMRQYRFKEARIGDVEVEINQLTSPPSAEAKVVGIFSVVDVQGQFPYNGRQLLIVDLQREGDVWFIVGYRMGKSRDYF